MCVNTGVGGKIVWFYISLPSQYVLMVSDSDIDILVEIDLFTLYKKSIRKTDKIRDTFLVLYKYNSNHLCLINTGHAM